MNSNYKNLSFDEWVKSCSVGCEMQKFTCFKCKKEWTYGEMGPFEGSFHDGIVFATEIDLQERYDYTSREMTVFLCKCGCVLKVVIIGGEDSDSLDFDLITEIR